MQEAYHTPECPEDSEQESEPLPSFHLHIAEKGRRFAANMLIYEAPQGWVRISKAAFDCLYWLYEQVSAGNFTTQHPDLIVAHYHVLLTIRISDVERVCGVSRCAALNSLVELDTCGIIEFARGKEDADSTYRCTLVLLESLEPRENTPDPLPDVEAPVEEITVTYEPSISPSRKMARLVERFAATCVYCKGTGTETEGPDGKSWHRDHVYPKYHGGADNPTNLVLSCATCNIRKHTLAADEFLAKLAAETA
jgi:5-methylcytosine-specific restriction endonuclease McrA